MREVEPEVFAEWKAAVLGSAAHHRLYNGEEELYWKRYSRDYEKNRTSGAHFHHVIDWLNVKIPQGSSVLEIGPGPAVFTRPLVVRCGSMTVVEPSPALAEQIEQAMRGYPDLNLVRERWEDVSLPLHDFVFCAGALHLFADIREALNKMINHARSKVLLVLLDDEQAIQREAAGFLNLKMRLPENPLSTLFAEVLVCLGLVSHWESFKEEQTYLYPNIDVLINLWKDDMQIDDSFNHDLMEFFREKGLCGGFGQEITVPRRFTSHLVEITV